MVVQHDAELVEYFLEFSGLFQVGPAGIDASAGMVMTENNPRGAGDYGSDVPGDFYPQGLETFPFHLNVDLECRGLPAPPDSPGGETGRSSRKERSGKSTGVFRPHP